jgi:hypothetical protein
MYRKLIPLLFLLFSGKLLAFEFPIEITEYIDDIKIIAYINERDINRESRWTPFDGPPPLSIYDALQAVQGDISSNAAITDTTLIGIELKQIPHHEMYWHYLVKVKFKLADKTQPHFFVVLMDGKVISALKRPESIK